MDGDQVIAALEQVRRIGRALREGPYHARPLLEHCARCKDARLPETFSTIGLAVARGALSPASFADMAVRMVGAEAVARLDRLEAANLRDLNVVASRTAPLLGPHDDAVLLGDDGACLSLYRSLAAFRIGQWVVGVPSSGAPAPVKSAMVAVLGSGSVSLNITSLGRLAEPLRFLSTVLETPRGHFRVPVDELLVVMLASRVGDPESQPVPPKWPHLAVALLAGRDRLRKELILELATQLDLEQRVHRGLEVAFALFPELREGWRKDSLAIPWWERTLALPIAVRRLVRDALDASLAWPEPTGFGSDEDVPDGVPSNA